MLFNKSSLFTNKIEYYEQLSLIKLTGKFTVRQNRALPQWRSEATSAKNNILHWFCMS